MDGGYWTPEVTHIPNSSACLFRSKAAHDAIRNTHSLAGPEQRQTLLHPRTNSRATHAPVTKNPQLAYSAAKRRTTPEVTHIPNSSACLFRSKAAHDAKGNTHGLA